eukprot:CAMPEP_0169182926 /NCGR_PEP_ID=MMETSP1016-20121227/349_1 /TAXON_ID=342587 /ORGANISM="Karlodinium micrum, Strain CCMP2283" /LENGTH=352 /DNA_ID=CAMNT_0009258247 /DNA_START=67 /DNA_END=1125 /DNA_ORIENTATION=+
MAGLLLLSVLIASVDAKSRRVELHVHLDGSIDAGELFTIAQRRGLHLKDERGPINSSAELEEYLLDIQPPWHRFDVINDIIGGDVKTIRKVAEDFVAHQARSGVVYTEVRYDPVRLAHSSLAETNITESEAVEAVRDGLAAGAEKYSLHVYQILCAMRGSSADACFKTAALAAKMRSSQMGGVVGLDLAGDETSYPNDAYIKCFKHAKHVLGLNTTVHAGEFKGVSPDEIRSAIVEMGADRIGHGYAAAADSAIIKLLQQSQVHVEACPASAQRHGLLQSVTAFRTNRLNFGLNTDDPSHFFGNTTLAKVESLVTSVLGFNNDDIEKAYSAALSATFGPLHSEMLQGSRIIV